MNRQRDWMAAVSVLAVVALVVAAVCLIVKPAPSEFANQALTGSTTNLYSLTLEEDLAVGDSLDLDGDLDFNGDGFDVDSTGGISFDADAASNFNVAGAGVDLTIESEAGRLILKGDEGAANAVHIDANDAVTTGLDIDVGSVSGLTIDGGLTNIGGGTPGLAAGDDDLYVTGDFEVDTTAQLDGDLDIGGLLQLSFADLAVSDGDTITPTVTVYSMDTTGAVTITLAASADEGQLLVLINDDANTCIIADTNLLSDDGNAITLTDADDTAVFVYQDASWHELLTITNQ